jgi:hypothetical protein
MPMYMHTNCLLFASCNKLLNNSTFYHLKSLIALPIGMIRGFFLGCATHPHTPLKFCPCMPTKNCKLIILSSIYACSTVRFDTVEVVNGLNTIPCKNYRLKITSLWSVRKKNSARSERRVSWSNPIRAASLFNFNKTFLFQKH